MQYLGLGGGVRSSHREHSSWFPGDCAWVQWVINRVRTLEQNQEHQFKTVKWRRPRTGPTEVNLAHWRNWMTDALLSARGTEAYEALGQW